MISIIIPSRDEPYLQKTIDSLLSSAKEDIEIIVVLDGYWPNPPLRDDNRVIIIHNSVSKGMRRAINDASNVAKGKYLMKTDAHCLWADGFDIELKKDLENNWLAVPSRYPLDAENWKIKEGKSYPIEYDYITFPYESDNQFGTGIHGKKWIKDNMGFQSYYHKEIEKRNIKIDEVISIQGSTWIVHKEHFNRIGKLDEVHSYNIYQEAQEMVFKTWLSGGKAIVNKNTWYAHWHKSSSNGWGLSKQSKLESERFHTYVWMNDKWPKANRKFEWLVNKFMPMPGWKDWQEKKNKLHKVESNFRIFDEFGNDGFL